MKRSRLSIKMILAIAALVFLLFIILINIQQRNSYAQLGETCRGSNQADMDAFGNKYKPCASGLTCNYDKDVTHASGRCANE